MKEEIEFDLKECVEAAEYAREHPILFVNVESYEDLLKIKEENENA